VCTGWESAVRQRVPTLPSCWSLPVASRTFRSVPTRAMIVTTAAGAEINTPNAWQRLGNGEELQATGGSRPDLIAKTRCQDCVDHGPW